MQTSLPCLLVHYQKYTRFWDPAQNYCFTIFKERGIVHHKPLDKVQFNFEAANCLKTRHGIGDYKIFLLRTAINIYGEQKSVQLSPEDACSVWQSNTLGFISVNNSCTYSVTSFRTICVDVIEIFAAVTVHITVNK